MFQQIACSCFIGLFYNPNANPNTLHYVVLFIWASPRALHPAINQASQHPCEDGQFYYLNFTNGKTEAERDEITQWIINTSSSKGRYLSVLKRTHTLCEYYSKRSVREMLKYLLELGPKLGAESRNPASALHKFCMAFLILHTSYFTVCSVIEVNVLYKAQGKGKNAHNIRSAM